MKYASLTPGQHHLLRFLKGDAFIATLTQWCVEQSIVCASFQGIGAAQSAEVGFYHLDTKEYTFSTLNRSLEIVSLLGNISLADTQPFVHAHAVFSDEQGTLYAGHLKEMIISATCELFLTTYITPIHRHHDSEIGLKLLEV